MIRVGKLNGRFEKLKNQVDLKSLMGTKVAGNASRLGAAAEIHLLPCHQTCHSLLHRPSPVHYAPISSSIAAVMPSAQARSLSSVCYPFLLVSVGFSIGDDEITAGR